MSTTGGRVISPALAGLYSTSKLLRLPDGTVVRDWATETLGYNEFDFSRVYARRGNRFAFGEAPWRLPAVIVSVYLARDGRVRVKHADGREQLLSQADFIDLVAADPLLAEGPLRGVPIVLWSDIRNTDLPRAIAQTTGCEVWFHTDKLTLEEQIPGSGVWHLAFSWPSSEEDVPSFAQEHKLHFGEWVLSRPGDREFTGPEATERAQEQASSMTARAVVDVGMDLVGDLRWRGGSGPDAMEGYQPSITTGWGHPNDFARWILDLSPEPGNQGVMNCWEAVFFCAYRAGVVDKNWLALIHQKAAGAARQAHIEVFPRALGVAPVWAYNVYFGTLKSSLFPRGFSRYSIGQGGEISRSDIPTGCIVSFNNLDHVALSLGTRDATGRQKLLSMWAFPAYAPGGKFDQLLTYGYMQVTSVEELLEFMEPGTVVEFGAPPW